MKQRLLAISNGHGEDNDASFVIRALLEKRPDIEISAVPIVGLGREYQRLGIPVVTPTRVLPSGGFFYQHGGMIWDDIRAGLVGLSLRQIGAVLREGRRHDGVLAVGDVVVQTLAWTSGRPFVGFISSLTALYNGEVELSFPLPRVLASPRCRAIATKDPASAEHLSSRGYRHAMCGGMVAVDWLTPSGCDLKLGKGERVVALLPGSRPPEATRNLACLMAFVRSEARRGRPGLAWRAALVPALRAEVGSLAEAEGWRWDGGWLTDGESAAAIYCPDDAFSDIVAAAEIGVGLAGLALEQVAASGKPVIQFPGEGPQFTLNFARRQERLLGSGTRTVGTAPPVEDDFRQAATLLREILDDPVELARCKTLAVERFSPQGASGRIADAVIKMLERS